MSAQAIDLRLAQFKRITARIGEAQELGRHDRVAYLLAEADAVFAALKHLMATQRTVPGPENAGLPMFLKRQAE